MATCLVSSILRGSNEVRQGASDVGTGRTGACAEGRYAAGVATFNGESCHLWWPQSLDNEPPPASRGPSGFELREDNDSETPHGMTCSYRNGCHGRSLLCMNPGHSGLRLTVDTSKLDTWEVHSQIDSWVASLPTFLAAFRGLPDCPTRFGLLSSIVCDGNQVVFPRIWGDGETPGIGDTLMCCETEP